MTRSSTPDPIHTIHGTIIRETEKALLIAVSAIGTGRFEEITNHWFPFSQVTKIFRSPPDETGKDYILVKEWLVREKGLLDKVSREQSSESSPPWMDDEPEHPTF